MGIKSDMVLMRRAIRNRWPVPAVLRAEVLTLAKELMESKIVDSRTKLGALKLVLEADRANMAATQIDLAAERIEAARSIVGLSVVDAMRECDAIERSIGEPE